MKKLFLAFLVLSGLETFAQPDHIGPAPQPPGVVIDYSPAASRIYVGSPSIAILPNGDYVASHDLFGPGSTEGKSGQTRIFRSADAGKSWRHIGDIDGQFWSNLFVHRGALYIMGPTSHYGSLVIRRSDDGGRTWTTPSDAAHGLLSDDGHFHTAPVPVVVHDGRLWRAAEDIYPTLAWGKNFRAFVISAAVDADLLRAENWRMSNRLAFDPAWFKGGNPGWLEGNVVVTPSGGLVDILRVNSTPRHGVAAVVQVSKDGKTVSFDPEHGFLDFPGGMAKFTIRYDAPSGCYWSLVDRVTHEENPSQRNVLALTSSNDLKHWTVRKIVLEHPGDEAKVGFQYVDWLIENDDIVAVCRTAWRDAHSYHDANYLTFHRLPNFRQSAAVTPSTE